MKKIATVQKGSAGPKLANFYPNVGRLQDYTRNISVILSKVNSDGPTKPEMISWMVQRFGTSSEFCRKLLEMLARLGVVARTGGRYQLRDTGEHFLETGDPETLVTLFRDKVTGVDEILQVLAGGEPVNRDRLRQRLNEQSVSIPRNQLEHRLNWLRGLGYADLVAGSILLTDTGMKLWTDVKIKSAPPQQREEISHNDIENKLQVIGEFFEFESTKRPSINQVLPSYALKLSEDDRQLDCLWVRYVHFAGKIKFPIEVHLSGNLADSLDRLETVSEYVQKAIIITTQDQERTIVDRLRVKRSRLLDKLVIVSVEDVYKIAEATNVLKSLSEKIFSN